MTAMRRLEKTQSTGVPHFYCSASVRHILTWAPLAAGIELRTSKTNKTTGSVPNLNKDGKLRDSNLRGPHHTAYRAVDPDPRGSAFIFPSGSGSRRETTEKYDEIGKNCKLIQFFKINLHKAHRFLLLRIFFMFLQLKKILHKGYIFQIFKAGSGSAFLKQLDPDPHSEKLLDPNRIKWMWIHSPDCIFFFLK